MRRLLAFLPLLVLLGCQDTSDGIDHAAVEQAQAPLFAAAKKSGGDWSKLSPGEQKLFLDRTRGNQAAAQQMLGMMGGQSPAGPPKR